MNQQPLTVTGADGMFATSVTYAWHNQGEGRYLMRTVTLLRNVGPGNQVVDNEYSSQVYVTNSDYAYGVEFADTVAQDEFLASMGA